MLFTPRLVVRLYVCSSQPDLRYKRIIWRDGVDPDIYRVRRILSRIGTIYPKIVVSVHGSDAITDIWSVVLVVFPDLLSDSTLRPAIGLNVHLAIT